MSRFLQKWDGSDRALFLKALLALVATLVAALAVLVITLFCMAYAYTGGTPLLPREHRMLIITRTFFTTAVVMFVSFGAVVVWISRMVVAHVRQKENARLAQEMQLARDIQLGALPQKFPPHPDHKEFDVYATMCPARDVGGDFYDFYFAGRDRFVFLVADVSGKGVPAALFMMRAKALLKGHIQTGIPLAAAVATVNDILCEDNTAGLFVTAWIAVLNTMTGEVAYVDAGHNPPLRRCADERRADYVRCDPDLILGAIAGTAYRTHDLRLRPGESLYLYTDGVTEQVNEAMELFGEERLRGILGGSRATQGKLLDYVSRCVARFGGAVEQTDDRTQLELVWRGRPVRTAHEYPPTVDGVAEAAADLDADLGVTLPFGMKMQILAAADEIFVNIVRYSGATKWSLTVERAAFPDEIRLVFEDDGKPFDPLQRKEPDTSVAIEDRPTGGLGIFIVRKTMSSVAYGRRFGRNVLVLDKTLEAPAEAIELSTKALLERKIAIRGILTQMRRKGRKSDDN